MIFAVDPGGTTGWALHKAGVVTYGQAAPLEFCTLAHTILADTGGEHVEVVVERYTIRQHTTQKSPQYDALEIIGTLRYLAFWLTSTELVMQYPHEAKGLVTNDRLRAFGWWAKGEDHARDALRHLGYRMLKRGLISLPSPI